MRFAQGGVLLQWRKPRHQCQLLGPGLTPWLTPPAMYFVFTVIFLNCPLVPWVYPQKTSIPLIRASRVPCQVFTDPRPMSPTCSSGIDILYLWRILAYLFSRGTSLHSSTKTFELSERDHYVWFFALGGGRVEWWPGLLPTVGNELQRGWIHPFNFNFE